MKKLAPLLVILLFNCADLLTFLKQNNVKVDKYTVVIYANQDWQSTPALIDGQADITIEAEGNWSMTDDRRNFDAIGFPTNPSAWGDYRVDKNSNHGALICTVNAGSNNQIFVVGQSSIVGNGSIYCRINDTDLANNVGSQNLKITVKKKLYNL
jgi:hypothetical protein